MYKGVFPPPQKPAQTITQRSFPFLYVVTIEGFHLSFRSPKTHSINLPHPHSAEYSSLQKYFLHLATSQCAQHQHQRSLSAACSSVSSGLFFACQCVMPCAHARFLI